MPKLVYDSKFPYKSVVVLIADLCSLLSLIVEGWFTLIISDTLAIVSLIDTCSALERRNHY